MSIPKFQSSLVKWFRIHQRDLPWRKTSDPYGIWISEIMLQQTGVSTVIPYYERFMKRFPSIQTLAAADEMEVLKFWEGLGYYRRAKNLHRAAKLIVKEFQGEFPRTFEKVIALPGIGRYSAGAILAIARSQRHPALDGNLIRVYSRFFAISQNVQQPKTLKRLWKIATDHVPEDAKDIRDFTEGMMELGALLCKPVEPQCASCPVNWGCKARALNKMHKFPKKSKTSARKKIHENIWLKWRAGKVAMLPKGADPKYPDFQRLPFEVASEAPSEKFFKYKTRYAVTDRDFVVYVRKDKWNSNLEKSIKWIPIKDLSQILLPSIDRKILRCLPGIFEKAADGHGSNSARNRSHR